MRTKVKNRPIRSAARSASLRSRTVRRPSTLQVLASIATLAAVTVSLAVPAGAATPTVTADRAPVSVLSTTGGAIRDHEVGADGRLYVLAGQAVAVYAAGASGSAEPTATHPVPLVDGQVPRALTVDGDGFVTVLSTDPAYLASTFHVLSPAGETVATRTGAQLGLTQPISLAAVGDPAVDHDYVAVVDNDSNGVAVLDLVGGRDSPVRSLPGGSTTRLVQPQLVAADASGRLVVAGYTVDAADHFSTWVAVFGPTADGETAPQRYLTGSRTRLGGLPSDVDTDGAGGVYVSAVDYAGGAASGARVVRLAASATGNAAPLAVLTGSRSGLGTFPSAEVGPRGVLSTVAYSSDGTGSTRVARHRALGPYAVPGKPSGVRVSGSTTSGQRSVSWRSAAVTSPDTPVTAYVVTVRCGTTTRLNKAYGASTRSTVVRLGTTRRGTCSVRVVARNVVGSGPAGTTSFTVRR